MDNIFKLSNKVQKEEIFEKLASGKDFLIERIVSTGQKSPDGFWYDQEKDEWVILLQGEAVLSYEYDAEICLNAGDYIFIPKHTKHRVEKTSTEPPCIWLAVHGNFDKD